jgi:hypothetical protein
LEGRDLICDRLVDEAGWLRRSFGGRPVRLGNVASHARRSASRPGSHRGTELAAGEFLVCVRLGDPVRVAAHPVRENVGADAARGGDSNPAFDLRILA